MFADAGARGLPLPQVLLAVSLPNALVEDLRRVIGRDITMIDVVSAPSLVYSLIRQSGACLLVPVPGDGELALLEQLCTRSANLPCVALYRIGFSSAASTLRLGAAGVTELITVAGNAEYPTLCAAISRCHTASIAQQVWRRCAAAISGPVAPLLQSALRLGHAPITAIQLATELGMQERTLRRHCKRVGVPSPQWIIGWARLLIAGFYLMDGATTIKSVALMLAYPSPGALGNQLRRYTKVTPSSMRSSAVLSTLVGHLQFALGTRCRIPLRYEGLASNDSACHH